jgi:putative peptidoglycan lipid II flippase
VILPALAVQHAKKSTGDFSRILDWGLRTMLVIGVPAMIGLILLAGPLVATLFGRGKFTNHDVEMSTYALWAYAPAFMGFSLVKVLIPGFYARQETRVPVRCGIIALISGSLLSISLFGLSRVFHWSAAHAGLAFATSFSACVNAMLLYRRLRADGIYLPGADWRKFWLRLCGASAAMIVVTLALNTPLQEWLALGAKLRVIHLLEIVSASAAVYFAVLFAAGMRLSDFRRH